MQAKKMRSNVLLFYFEFKCFAFSMGNTIHITLWQKPNALFNLLICSHKDGKCEGKSENISRAWPL